MFVIRPINQLSYNSIPRNSTLGLDITNQCDLPHRVLVVDSDGECFICACEAWLPITVGNINDFDELSDVWNTPVARALQQDIDSKKFTHCAVDRCGILNSDQRASAFAGFNEQDAYYISINIDESCNLKCPSCRPEAIMKTEGAEYEKKLAQVNKLVAMLERFDHPALVILSGNGDPLASGIMRPLLHNWRPNPKHRVRLFTNGLLLEKQLTDNVIVNNISQYFISIDAGSPEVYEHVRQPGKFVNLINNFDFLRNLVDSTGSEVLLKFVLQRANYKDMQNFIDLCDRYKFKGVINRLENWGTWPDFDAEDVIGNLSHAMHQDAMNNLRLIYQKYSLHVHFNPSLAALAQQ
jgi:MoaA/NifB/PqqE/SkfB family radical SAM enzyme